MRGRGTCLDIVSIGGFRTGDFEYSGTITREVGLEGFTAVVMVIFWDIMPCSSLSVNRCFGGTYHLHLQGRGDKFSKKPASKQASKQASKHGGDMFLRNVG
jgi:hypothetical protein